MYNYIVTYESYKNDFSENVVNRFHELIKKKYDHV